MKLSIITINYNNASELERTIESVVTNKTADIEYIVVDGGSTDTSIDIIHHYKDGIDQWMSEPDKGIYNAMNKGIKMAKGEYVMFVNSGDTLFETIDFNKILSRINGEDIIYHNLEIAEENTTYIKNYPADLSFKYFAEDSLPHLGTLIKRDLFERYGFYNEDFKIVADWAFFMDCVFLHSCSYKYIDDCFSTFYLGGISSQPHNFSLLMSEKDKHIAGNYPNYSSLYLDWKKKKDELYKLKNSTSVRYLKRIGFLKWLEI